MKQLCFSSAIDIAAAIRSGKISAVECLDYFHQRIDRFNPSLNAVVVLDWARARERAARADQAQARGESWGPLHGVPMTIKESFDLAGHRTTWGDPVLADNVAAQDDLIAQRIESAGAAIFGKTNVPLRLMDFQSFNEIYGTTNNPWDITRGPGGSSGGAAAALAAGLTGLELGSDIGGSIRNPAHYCGVFGHKPTFALVGATRSAPPTRHTPTDMAVCGPLARSAEDLALAMQFIAAPNAFESSTWSASLRKPSKTLAQYRVAVWHSEPGIEVDDEIAERCAQLADRLAKLGAKVSDKARPELSARHSTSVYRRLLDAATNPFGDLRHAEWLDLDNERAKLRLAWREFFKDWDIVIAPISATPAFKHDHSALAGRTLAVNGGTVPYFQQLFWAGIVTVSYLPSTVFPTGPGKLGLPIGLQAFGAAYDDFITIDFARLVSQEFGGFTPPSGYSD